MGKIILEFDSQEEQEDAKTVLDGWRWQHAMWELDQKLRQTTKYGHSVIHSEAESATGEEQDIAEKYREMIRDILNNSNLKLD